MSLFGSSEQSSDDAHTQGRRAMLALIGVATGVAVLGLALPRVTSQSGAATQYPAPVQAAAAGVTPAPTPPASSAQEAPSPGIPTESMQAPPPPSGGQPRSWGGGPSPVNPLKFRHVGFPAPGQPQRLAPRLPHAAEAAAPPGTVLPRALEGNVGYADEGVEAGPADTDRAERDSAGAGETE